MLELGRLWYSDRNLTAATTEGGEILPVTKYLHAFGKEMYHEGDKEQAKDVNGKNRSNDLHITRWMSSFLESYLVKKGSANLDHFLSIAFLIFLILYEVITMADFQKN